MEEDRRPKISVITLGCSKNTVDSEVLLGQLKRAGTAIVNEVGEADIAVINTCGFIEAAKRESIDAIVEAAERKCAGQLKKVVVMGCLSQRFSEELATEIPEVDAYFGCNDLPRVVAELGIDYRRELLGERWLTTPKHFAYLKISEGCDHPCSFCAIPLMRGAHRSRPMEELTAEAESLAARGVKELILIAQDTTAYGLDLHGGRLLPRLMERLCLIRGIEWIRLMYAYPARFPQEVLEVYRQSPKICRYLDLPVQHVSDRVLRSMRRGISGRGVRSLIGTIRAALPEVALRTTLIVGYPEETDEEFRMLCDFVRETGFHRLGVFTYSHEEGTASYQLEDSVPTEVKEERRARIMEIQQEISEARNRTLVGTSVKVMIDRREGEFLVGRTEWDAPEIDQEVYVRGGESVKEGHFCTVRVVEATEYDLVAERL